VHQGMVFFSGEMNVNDERMMQVTYTMPYAQPTTSPWTEAFDRAAATPGSHDGRKSAFDMNMSEMQPTRDALSDIYNRGYEE